MKRGVLLIAHGSPRQEANEDFVALTSKVQSRLPDHLVQHAFLDCTHPTIPEGIDLLVDKKVDEIVVLPYFLVSGRHTVQDIAALVDGKKKEYPSVRIDLKQPVGSSPEMLELILRSLQD